MPTKKKKERRGRPKYKPNWKVIDKLLEEHCKQNEIAAYLGIWPQTLADAVLREKGMPYHEYADWKRSGGKASLRRLQFLQAKNGSTKMAIHLGKHYLDQTDRTKVEQVSTTVEVDLSKLTDEELEAFEALKRKLMGDD